MHCPFPTFYTTIQQRRLTIVSQFDDSFLPPSLPLPTLLASPFYSLPSLIALSPLPLLTIPTAFCFYIWNVPDCVWSRDEDPVNQLHL